LEIIETETMNEYQYLVTVLLSYKLTI